MECETRMSGVSKMGKMKKIHLAPWEKIRKQNFFIKYSMIFM